MALKLQQWFSDNTDFVQAVAAAIQTIIAGLMLWTLFQTRQTLDIAKLQLEATIEPVLSPVMFGNIIRLTNEGAIDVTRVSLTAVIAGWFDINTGRVSEYQVARTQKTLTNSLCSEGSLDIDLKSHLIPLPTDSKKDATTGMTVCGLVLTYRRTADMKTFTTFLPFSMSKDRAAKSTDIFLPLFPSPNSSETAPSGTTSYRIMEEARAELLSIYKDKIAQIRIE